MPTIIQRVDHGRNWADGFCCFSFWIYGRDHDFVCVCVCACPWQPPASPASNRLSKREKNRLKSARRKQRRRERWLRSQLEQEQVRDPASTLHWCRVKSKLLKLNNNAITTLLQIHLNIFFNYWTLGCGQYLVSWQDFKLKVTLNIINVFHLCYWKMFNLGNI